MKLFNLNNLEKTNLVLEIGSKTYSDDFFTLNGVTSFTKGAISTTSGSVSILGDYSDFVNVSNNAKAYLYLQTDTSTTLFLTFYIQKPYTYDGEYITAELDTIPAKDTIGYTDTYGRGLPCSFGRPFVKPVPVSTPFKGVILEDQYSLNPQDVNNILEAYLACQESFSEAIVVGMPNTNDTNLQNIKYYNDLIVSYVDKVRHNPAVVAIVENFFSLIYWRGSIGRMFLGDVSATAEEDQAVADALDAYSNAIDNGEPDSVLQTLLQDISAAREKGSKKIYYSNLGMLPPLSLHSILNTNDTLEVDYNVSHSYANPIGSIDDNLHRYSNLLTGDFNVRLSSIKSQILNWINQLMDLPTSFKIDLGDYVGEACLDINGLNVKGTYSNKVFTVTHRGYEETLWNMVPASGAYKVSVSSSTEKAVDLTLNPELPNSLKTAEGNLYVNGVVRDLNGKYLLVSQTFVDLGRVTTFRFAAYVIAQDDDVLTLDSLPFINVSQGSNYNPSRTLYHAGVTSFTGTYRNGSILGVSSSLEALVYQGNIKLYAQPYGYFLPQQQVVQSPFYWVQDIPSGGVEEESKIIYAREWSSTLGRGDSKSVTYRNPLYPIIDPINVTENDGSVVMLGQETTYLGKHQKVGSKSSYVYSFTGGSFLWELKTGQEVTLSGDFFNIYIVDYRPNISVVSVKSKIGEQYTVVPPAYYTVDSEYKYEDIFCTAIYFTIPLTKRFEGFTDDLVVFVDVGVYSPTDMVSGLVSSLGLTVVAQNTLPVFEPNFVEYGYTDILSIVYKIFEQTNCGWFISNTSLKVKNLLTSSPSPQTYLTLDNIESFVLQSADILDLYNNTVFSWETLDLLGAKTIVRLAKQEPSLVTNSSKDVEIFQDRVQSLSFAKFFIHRNSRNWDTIEINGFIDSANLEPYDIVSVSLGTVSALGEVQTIDFNHLTSEVRLEILISSIPEMSLWSLGSDIIVSSLKKAYGHVSTCNAELINYYD